LRTIAVESPRRRALASASPRRIIHPNEEKLGPQGEGLIELDEARARRRPLDRRRHLRDGERGRLRRRGGEEGGSRGFTLCDASGRVEWESGASCEREIGRADHFPAGARGEHRQRA
jgi:hypothetical protein